MNKACTEQDIQKELVSKIKGNDESALRDVLCYYAPRIENFLLNKYRGQLNNADVEDVTCIAIRKFWKNRQKYDDKRVSVRAYLYFIANRVALDVLRAGWYKASQLEQPVEQDFLEQSLKTDNHLNQSPTEAQDFEESEISKATNKVLSDLPDIQQKILLADAMCDGVAHSEELGERLGYPATTIRQYRKRAKKAFIEGMSQLGFDIPEVK